MEMSQSRLQEEAAVRVQAMALRNIREDGAELAQLAETAKIPEDPATGNFIDRYM